MVFDFDELIDRRQTGSIKWSGSPNELPMWVADMDFKAAPAIIEALRQRIDHGVFGYTEPDDDWFNAYHDYYLDVHNWKIDKGSLIFATGVVPIISSSVRKLTAVGDNVVVMPPVYNIFYNSIVNNARKPLEVPLLLQNGVYEMDWEGLEKAFSLPETKLLILCNPHNPVGRIWSKEELARLAKLAKEHDVIVLSDEIHGEITPLEKPYIPFYISCEEAKEIGYAAISPTKCFNLAGIQTAAMVIDNAEIREKVDRQINTDEVAEPNVFAVPATIAAFKDSRDWLNQMRRYVFDNRANAERFIEEKIKDLKAIRGEATYLLWVDCSSISSDSRPLLKFLRESVELRLSDGEEYGTGGQGFFRMNLACPRSRLQDGLERLAKGIELFKKQ